MKSNYAKNVIIVHIQCLYFVLRYLFHSFLQKELIWANQIFWVSQFWKKLINAWSTLRIKPSCFTLHLKKYEWQIICKQIMKKLCYLLNDSILCVFTIKWMYRNEKLFNEYYRITASLPFQNSLLLSINSNIS